MHPTATPQYMERDEYASDMAALLAEMGALGRRAGFAAVFRETSAQVTHSPSPSPVSHLTSPLISRLSSPSAFISLGLLPSYTPPTRSTLTHRAVTITMPSSATPRSSSCARHANSACARRTTALPTAATAARPIHRWKSSSDRASAAHMHRRRTHALGTTKSCTSSSRQLLTQPPLPYSRSSSSQAACGPSMRTQCTVAASG